MSERSPSGSGPEHPRSTPEIIPPAQTKGRARPRIFVYASEDDSGGRRVYVARPGPFTIIVALAILALIAAVMLIVLLSVALIWIPVVIVLVLTFAAMVYWRRFQAWLARR